MVTSHCPLTLLPPLHGTCRHTTSQQHLKLPPRKDSHLPIRKASMSQCVPQAQDQSQCSDHLSHCNSQNPSQNIIICAAWEARPSLNCRNLAPSLKEGRKQDLTSLLMCETWSGWWTKWHNDRDVPSSFPPHRSPQPGYGPWNLLVKDTETNRPSAWKGHQILSITSPHSYQATSNCSQVGATPLKQPTESRLGSRCAQSINALGARWMVKNR